MKSNLAIVIAIVGVFLAGASIVYICMERNPSDEEKAKIASQMAALNHRYETEITELRRL